MTILIVDDVAYMRMVIKDILVKHCGYDKQNILEAAGGYEAIKMYKKEKPDIVLCDILMPDMGGIEVVEKLIELDSNAKIIMCTSSSEIENVTNCVHIGAKDYILKPPKPERVKQAIEKVINGNQSDAKAGDKTPKVHDEPMPTHQPLHHPWQKEIESLRKDVDFLMNEVAALKKK